MNVATTPTCMTSSGATGIDLGQAQSSIGMDLSRSWTATGKGASCSKPVSLRTLSPYATAQLDPEDPGREAGRKRDPALHYHRGIIQHKPRKAEATKSEATFALTCRAPEDLDGSPPMLCVCCIQSLRLPDFCDSKPSCKNTLDENFLF